MSVASPLRPGAGIDIGPVGRGPVGLGRHVVVAPGVPEPPAWTGCRRIVIDAAAGDDPAQAVDAIRTAAAAAESLVIELSVELASSAEVERRPQHDIGPGYTLLGDELADLVWRNSVDARDGAPMWDTVRRALALGATRPDDGATGDVVLPDGRPVWIDGGPIRHLDPIDGVPVMHAMQLEHGRLDLPLANTTEAELASDQLAAVTHAGGSARIIAPAGSGKTRVLTERARHLLRVWRLPSSAVSLVAFNKRAQEEMQERTSDLAGLNVRTLNSIALAIINGTPPFAPQQRRWRTIDEHEVRSILQRFVQTSKKLNVDPLAPWIDALSSIRLGLLDPQTVAVRYGGDVDGLPDVWPSYRDALEAGGLVDFDDQIRRAIDVLLTQPDARRAAQRACAVLLVDEFQDLTPAHMLLIRLLSARGGVVFGVGDDDQTIYGYNGADPSWLIDFTTWFPGAGDHPLEVNYRCPADVVEVADRLLRHNRRRVAKVIRASAPASTSPGWSVVEGDDPVASTVEAVLSAIEAGATTAEIAVLTRVNAIIAPVQIALSSRAIPISGGVGAEFADRVAVRAALAWIRLASGTTLRADDLAEASRRPSRGFSSRLRGWVSEQGSVDKLLRLADRLNEPKDAQRVTDLAGDIARLQSLVASGADTGRVLEMLIDEIGLGGAVASLDRNRYGMNRAAQGDDLLALRQLGRMQPAPRQFESWLRDALFAKRHPDGVVLATVHRVKGQEWPHVVVHLAQDALFPHRLAEDHEEERRLFHVAITRASRHVTIVAGDDPSPFVGELTNEPPAHRPIETSNTVNTVSSPTRAPPRVSRRGPKQTSSSIRCSTVRA